MDMSRGTDLSKATFVGAKISPNLKESQDQINCSQSVANESITSQTLQEQPVRPLLLDTATVLKS